MIHGVTPSRKPAALATKVAAAVPALAALAVLTALLLGLIAFEAWHLAAARDAFSPREIVELIVAAGYYQLLAALMNSVDIDLDEPAGTAVIDAAPSRPDG